MKEWKIGDKAWIARLNRNPIQVPCPVCMGEGWLDVRPFSRPEGEFTKVRCDYCSRYENSNSMERVALGTVPAYQMEASTCEVVIDGMEVTKDRPTRYKYGSTSCSNYSCDGNQLFETEADAMEEASKMAQKQEIADDANRMSQGKYNRENAGWYLGYHANAIKKAQEDVEYHRKKLDLPKEMFDKWSEGVEQQLFRLGKIKRRKDK